MNFVRPLSDFEVRALRFYLGEEIFIMLQSLGARGVAAGREFLERYKFYSSTIKNTP